jgi:hypothetical protein
VPRGLPATQQQVRLVHRDSGTPVATWTVLPSDAGEPADRTSLSTPPVGADIDGSAAATYATTGAIPRPRSQDLDQPDVASGVAGAGGPDVHDPAVVHRGVLGLGVLALLVVGAGVLTSARHRPPRTGGASRA